MGFAQNNAKRKVRKKGSYVSKIAAQNSKADLSTKQILAYIYIYTKGGNQEAPRRDSVAKAGLTGGKSWEIDISL